MQKSKKQKLKKGDLLSLVPRLAWHFRAGRDEVPEPGAPPITALVLDPAVDSDDDVTYIEVLVLGKRWVTWDTGFVRDPICRHPVKNRQGKKIGDQK